MNSKNNKKIKLTHIICSLGYGGAEKFLIDLIKNTDREKYEISVLCVVEGGPLVKELELNGTKIFIIGKKTKLGISTIWKIYKYLKKKRYKSSILIFSPEILGDELPLFWREHQLLFPQNTV